jgi:microcystin-dependent protein
VSQASYQLPTSGTLSGFVAVSDINAALASVSTMNSGTAAPPFGTWSSSVPAGAFWLDTSTTPWEIQIGDGTDWLPFGYLDPVNHVFTPAGPTGTIGFFAGAWTGGSALPPPGTLLCYGQVVAIASYPNLFAAIGAVYGGDGISTFGIPDLRGRALAGIDNMGGTAASRLTSYVLGTTGGGQNVTLVTSEFPPHTHGVNDSGHIHTAGTAISDPGHLHGMGLGNEFDASRSTGAVVGPGGDVDTSTSGTGISATTTVNGAYTGITIADTGGGGSHANVQPTMTVNAFIWI